MRILAIALVSLMPLTLSWDTSTRAAAALNKSPKIGIIKKPFSTGCGCKFQFPNDYRNRNHSFVFISCDVNQAQINIDGKDLMLTLLKRNEPKQELKVGYHYSEEYQAGKVKVKIESVVNRVCDPEDENCETWGEVATITVYHNGGLKKVNTIGWCGN